MKKGLLLFLIIGTFLSCQKEDDLTQNGVVGTWKLVEFLIDPGDGSGTFQSVESEKRITFKSDGSLTSNGDLCSMSPETGNPTSGAYSLADSTITSLACSNLMFDLTFIIKNDQLIIRYPCIEPCGLKFQKE